MAEPQPGRHDDLSAVLARRLQRTVVPERRGGATHAPLTEAQRAIWLAWALDPNRYPRHLRTLVLHGALPRPVLEAAVERLVQFADTLRCSYPLYENQPRQQLHPVTDVPRRWREAPDESALAAVLAEAAAEAEGSLDLRTTVPPAVTIVRRRPDEHLVIIACHHLSIDGWSMGHLAAVLRTACLQLAAGDDEPSSPAGARFLDIAAQLPVELDTAPPDQRWAHLLADAEPIDRWKGPLAAGGALVDAYQVDPAAVQRLRALAESVGTTLFASLLATVFIVLGDACHLERPLVGVPMANRADRRSEAAIGRFSGQGYLAGDLRNAPTVSELIGRTGRDLRVLADIRSRPAAHALAGLAPQSRYWATPVIVQMQHFGPTPSAVGAPYVVATDIRADGTTPLGITASLLADGSLRLLIRRNPAVGTEEELAEVAGRVLTGLHRIVEMADRPWREVAAAARSDRGIVGCADPDGPLAPQPEATVLEALRAWVEATPSAIAVHDVQCSISYAELADRAAAVAAALRAHGLAAGDTVAITGPRGAATVVAMVGTLAAGGVMMPLATRLGVGALTERLATGATRFELAVGAPTGLVPTTVRLGLDGVLRAHDESPNARSAPLDTARSRVEPTAADPAYLFFTSGTVSGHARAVLGRHGSLRQFIDWQRERFQIGPNDRVAMFTAISGDVTLRNVFLALLAGGCVVVAPDELDPADAAAWLASARVTVLHLTPTVAEHVLAGLSDRAESGELRWTFFGGEPLTASLVRRWRGQFSHPGWVVNLYGPTETTMARAAFMVPDVLGEEPIPVGWALPGSELHLVTNEQFAPPSKRSGEVMIRTCHGTLGYLGDPEGWAQRAVWERTSGVLRYHTGDQGSLRADGALVLSGRLDDEVKIEEIRVEPADIAARLRRLAGVTNAEVVAQRPHGGEARLSALVVRSDPFLSAAMLRRALAEHVPAALVPATIRFVDQIPVAPSGKADRTAIRGLLDLPVVSLTAAGHIGALAEADPNRSAFISGGRTVDRAGLEALVSALAARLQQAGVKAGSLVAVSIEADLEVVAALLAVHRCGAGYLALPRDLPAARRDLLIDELRPPVLVTDRPDEARVLDGHAPPIVVVDVATTGPPSPDDPDRGPGEHPATARRPGPVELSADPNHLAYVIATSGSTGRPSPVAVPHGALRAFVEAAITRYGLGPHDRMLRFHSYGFDGSVEEIFCTLAAGATLVSVDGLQRGGIGALLHCIAEQQVTVLSLPTSYWHTLVAELHAGTVSLPDCVRLVLIGGGAADAEAVRRWHQAVGGQARLINTYGPTECTVVAITAELSPGIVELTGRVPIGVPLAGTLARVDGEELLLGGAQLALGYLGRADLNEERFVTLAGTRWYRTGDRVAIRPDGGYDFLGRIDDQVKIRGVRVEPGEVEAALRQLVGVSDAAVLSRAGPDGQPTLIGHVESTVLNASELRRSLAKVLPAAFIPTAFVLHNRLPRTTGAKVDRATLRDFGQTPSTQTAFNAAHPPTTAELVRPSGQTPEVSEWLDGPGEQLATLVQLWREILEDPELGADADFFEAGGHSLHAVRLFSRLEHRTGLTFPLHTLFEHPTPAMFATYLAARWHQHRESAAAGATQSAVTSQPDGPAGRVETPVLNAPGPTGDPAAQLAKWSRGRARGGDTDPASWLVTMRRGEQGAPLHLTYPSGGFLFHYERFVAHLAPGRAVRGIEARGIAGSGRFAPSLEAMGADAAAAITSAPLDRPVLLGGYSSGALVAMEAARHLLARGIEIAALVLLEPTTDWNLISPPSWHRRRSGYRADLYRHFQLRQSQRRGERIDPVLLGSLNVTHHRRVLVRYRPVPLPRAVPTLLVVGADDGRSPGAEEASHAKWTWLLGGAAQQVRTPGTHSGQSSLLTPPQVSAVAQAVDSFLAGMDR